MAIELNPSTQLVDIVSLLRMYGLFLRWNVKKRALEIVPL